MRQQLSAVIIRFVTHPYTRLFVGASLILAGLDDILEDLDRGEFWELGVHHGVVVFGFYKLLGAIADVLHGLETAVETEH
jgi:hypothetical protein